MDKGTIVRTIALVITWMNIVLVNKELQPIPVIDDETIAYGLAFFVSVWAWFKNNYVTAKGNKQKEVLLKEGLTKGSKND
ncbi:phage holin [Alkalihalobacillus trypoxylicola]|uniref:Holin n=1 Tax=Alkalihalobacillus trypoxylicola TaxID=519424 RepID=A0A161PDJ8_9BACI|nr:phage holin [Alkalihalobacillus trypoxylicola]KYG30414.1 holin [Alkalihalobacillus trypoxylicola]